MDSSKHRRTNLTLEFEQSRWRLPPAPPSWTSRVGRDEWMCVCLTRWAAQAHLRAHRRLNVSQMWNFVMYNPPFPAVCVDNREIYVILKNYYLLWLWIPLEWTPPSGTVLNCACKTHSPVHSHNVHTVYVNALLPPCYLNVQTCIICHGPLCVLVDWMPLLCLSLLQLAKSPLEEKIKEWNQRL